MALNKKIISWCNENNYKIENSKIYGKKEDIYFSIISSGNYTFFYFNMTSPVKDINSKLKEALKVNKKIGKRMEVIKDNDFTGIAVRTQIGLNVMKVEDLTEIMEIMINSFKELGGEPSTKCINCGKDTEKNMVFGNYVQTICNECENDIKDKAENHKDSALSYIRGFIGAALGAIIGGIPWLIVYLMGWVVGLLAFVIGITSFWGYKLFRGPKNRTVANGMIYFCSIISIFLWWAAIIFVAYIGSQELGYNYTLQEIAMMDITSLVISLVIGVAGLVGIGQRISTYTIPRKPKELDII